MAGPLDVDNRTGLREQPVTRAFATSIYNPSFESALNGWTTVGSCGWGTSTTWKNSGDVSVKFRDLSTTGICQIYQVLDVTAGQTVIWSAYVKLETQTAAGTQLWLEFAGDSAIHHVTVEATPGVYYMSVSAVAPATTTAKVSIRSTMGALGTYYVDDALFQSTVGVNNLANSGFEGTSGLSGWILEGPSASCTAALSSTWANSGTQSVRITDSSASSDCRLLQNMPAAPGENFVAKAYIKTLSNNGVRVMLRWFSGADGSGTILKTAYSTAMTIGTFSLGASGVAPAGTASVQASFYSPLSGTSESFVDDFTLRYVTDNNAPIPCFSSSVTEATVSVSATCSSDPDGHSLTFAWDWQDGTPGGSGSSSSHTFSCFLELVTIKLTATDQFGKAAFTTQTVLLETDDDEDGLSDCDEEFAYGTSPTDPDSDNDGVQDGLEAESWGAYWNTDFDGDGAHPESLCSAATDSNLCDSDSDRDSIIDGIEILAPQSIFCHAGSCVTPDPKRRDIFVYEQWMDFCLDSACAASSHPLPEAQEAALRTTFDAHGISLHFLKGGVVPYQNPQSWSEAGAYYNAFVSVDRRPIFHYMLIADSTDACPLDDAIWGLGPAPGFMFTVYQGCISEYPWSVDDFTLKVTAHELGHNIIGDVDPAGDRYAADNPTHDGDTGYSLYPTVRPWRAADYNSNRWANDMTNIGAGLNSGGGPAPAYAPGVLPPFMHADRGPASLEEREWMLAEIRQHT